VNRAVAALTRLRRLALDAAKRDLAATLAAEEEARGMAEATSRTIAREATFADASAGTHGPNAFAAWLTKARTQHDAARGAHAHAEAQTGRARLSLADARIALRIVEETAKRHQAATADILARAAQRDLDEIGQRGATGR
jgi:hypothetical protein